MIAVCQNDDRSVSGLEPNSASQILLPNQVAGTETCCHYNSVALLALDLHVLLQDDYMNDNDRHLTLQNYIHFPFRSYDWQLSSAHIVISASHLNLRVD